LLGRADLSAIALAKKEALAKAEERQEEPVTRPRRQAASSCRKKINFVNIFLKKNASRDDTLDAHTKI
jgi:hypothetical protein